MDEGIYFDLSFEEYQKADGISQSLLKEFGAAATPLHFSVREPRKQTPDMAFGEVCHAAVLTPDKFAESYYLKPETYGDGKAWNGNATECKTWLLTHADRPVMTKPDLEHVAKVRETLTTSPKLEVFRDALKIGKTEVSFFKRDEETGLMLKARVDLMAVDVMQRTWLWDLKKCQSGEATPKSFGVEIENRGYHIQMASYLYITGATRFVFVVFDDSPPYDAAMFEPPNDVLNRGHAKWRQLLRAYARCVEKNEWPGYQEGIQRTEIPRWAQNEI